MKLFPLACVALLGLASPYVYGVEGATDISRSELGGMVLQGLATQSNANQELADERFIENAYAPSFDMTIERGDLFPDVIGTAKKNFEQIMSDEVKHGAGRGDNVLSESTYMDNHGSDTGAHNAATLLGATLLHDNDVQSAQRWMRNVTNPFPTKGSAGGGGMSEEDKQALRDEADLMGIVLDESDFESDGSDDGVAKLMRQATSSAGQYSLATMLANRQGAPSMMEFMMHESSFRIHDQNWHNEIVAASTEALLREQLYLDSYRVWQEYQRYLQGERQEAMLAVMISALNKMTGMVDMAGSEMSTASQYTPDVSGSIELD